MIETLAGPSFDSPLFWAVVIGWIITVTFHEFAHGIVAHWGGDYTIAERGGLTLNPLQYIDLFNSIILPAIFLMIGGIPLPGGVTYVRLDLLRSRAWESGVALAGPGMNLLLFFICALPLHPAFGWVQSSEVSSWTTAQVFLGAMATLMFLTMVINLLPIPSFDGFNALAPFMNRDTVLRLSTPPTSITIFLFAFIVLWMSGIVLLFVYAMVFLLQLMGFGATAVSIAQAMGTALFRY
jgi:Zn-dependent protease